MKINKKEIKKEFERNFKERLSFVKLWTDYIKTHSDEDWSEQQNLIINSQLNSN
jgi:hypothetical protein